ncbi:hypothetical protein V2J61_00010, partial [Pseudomonas aeruginosa]|uniref:hypothetical protein n=1 Tax=Pseudomonas aeruginosa TaxID=287 RepID=UPI002EA4A242|nr:hypothetical protein [Pseudomonas aeruginosa]
VGAPREGLGFVGWPLSVLVTGLFHRLKRRRIGGRHGNMIVVAGGWVPRGRAYVGNLQKIVFVLDGRLLKLIQLLTILMLVII